MGFWSDELVSIGDRRVEFEWSMVINRKQVYFRSLSRF